MKAIELFNKLNEFTESELSKLDLEIVLYDYDLNEQLGYISYNSDLIIQTKRNRVNKVSYLLLTDTDFEDTINEEDSELFEDDFVGDFEDDEYVDENSGKYVEDIQLLRQRYLEDID